MVDVMKRDAASMDEVRAFFDEMVDLLGLQAWRLTHRAYPTDEGANMAEIDVNHPAQSAHVDWSAFMFTDDRNVGTTQPWQVTVIHELLHPRLAVYRDHLRQTAIAVTEDHPQQGELLCNIGRDLEEASVEQAAWAIWKLYQRLKGRTQWRT